MKSLPTPREGVNQTFFTYLAWLQNTEKFDTTSSERLQVDHTHNEIDQRFSEVGSTLSRAPVLEEPEDFRDWMITHVKLVRGRRLHVEILQSTLDFQNWTFPFGLQISGITSNACEPDVNHCWKFVTRELANDCLGNDLTEVHHADMQELPKNSKDIVLLVKQFIHSTCLSQAPLLALPVGHGGAFNATDLQVPCLYI